MARPVASCRLCRETHLLCESHLIAKSFYKRLRDDEGIFVNRHDGRLISTDHQVKEYLLCTACEERFSRNGESWVFANSASLTGFPLRSALYRVTAIAGNEQSLTFRADVPGVEINQLVYFATSVIWRASVGTWNLLERWFDSSNKPDLGIHEEALRLYLLGRASFPPDGSLSIHACNSEAPAMTLTYPGSLGIEENGSVQFSFNVPGLLFYLRLNDPRKDRLEFSIVNNPRVPIIQVSPAVWDFVAKTHRGNQAHPRHSPTYSLNRVLNRVPDSAPG